MLAEIAADNYIKLHILNTFITYYITLHCDILNNDTHSILVLLFFFLILFHCCKHIGAPEKNEPTTVAKITAAATRNLQINDTQFEVNFAVQVVTDLNLTPVNKSRK